MALRLFRGSVLALVWSLTLIVAGCSGSSGGASAPADQGSVIRDDPPQETSPPPEEDVPPAGDPNVDLTASDSVVGAGESVQLSWSSENVSDCSASGGWSGDRGTEGSVAVGPIEESTTFTLTCSGPGGNAVAMLSVSVLGVVSLNWQPPTENVDGSPLQDLAGYRIYYGSQSRDYTEQLAVGDAGSTSRDLELVSGSYYFAMTALDADGNESVYSNEIVKVVN